jgi:hypothetical protein
VEDEAMLVDKEKDKAIKQAKVVVVEEAIKQQAMVVEESMGEEEVQVAVTTTV